MSHPSVHSRNNARKFGGVPEDYLAINEWFDQSKEVFPDMRHRALRHHSAGIFECERVFGKSFINSDGKTVYTRYVGEQHVIEDLGFIPTLEDWFENMELQEWMMCRSKETLKVGKKLPKSLEANAQLIEENERLKRELDLAFGALSLQNDEELKRGNY